ncbi:MAG: class I adenylate-forming enzyme family protein [Anaerovoracaceae bacterium]
MELTRLTIVEKLKERVDQMPKNLAIRFEGTDYNWEEVDNISNKLANQLMGVGMNKGDHIGIIGGNCEAWVFYFLAILKIGAKAVVYNTRLKDVELKREIKIATTKTVIYGKGGKGETFDTVLKKFEEKNIVETIINMKKEAKYWKTLGETKEELVQNCEIDCHDVAAVLFTSGTTGNSKGVQLTHYNVINNAIAIVENMRWQDNDRICVCVPLFHTFGITTCILSSIISGAGMVILARSRTVEICSAIEHDMCTVLNGVPSMFLAVLRNEKRHNYNITKLKSGIIAGSPIFRDDYLDICHMFDNIKLQTSYGQTETSPCITISDYDDSLETKATTSGRPIDNIEVRIISINGNKLCLPFEEGEIQVKGYNVMKGYMGNEEETQKAFTEDGWLRTGDLGFFNNKGYINITGRCKNIIIKGGENISPVEIENAIKKVAKKCEVKVFGVPSIVVQEEIVACIEGEFDDKLRDKILEYLRANISDYKVPKYVIFVEELPRTSSGKIDEKCLKQETIKRLNI